MQPEVLIKAEAKVGKAEELRQDVRSSAHFAWGTVTTPILATSDAVAATLSHRITIAIKSETRAALTSHRAGRHWEVGTGGSRGFRARTRRRSRR